MPGWHFAIKAEVAVGTGSLKLCSQKLEKDQMGKAPIVRLFLWELQSRDYTQ